MATDAGILTSDAAILSRLIRPEEGKLSAEAAEGLLAIRFEPGNPNRIRELLAGNQEDRLAPGERAELENYRRVSFLLDLMHSKARRALKTHGAADEEKLTQLFHPRRHKWACISDGPIDARWPDGDRPDNHPSLAGQL